MGEKGGGLKIRDQKVLDEWRRGGINGTENDQGKTLRDLDALDDINELGWSGREWPNRVVLPPVWKDHVEET